MIPKLECTIIRLLTIAYVWRKGSDFEVLCVTKHHSDSLKFEEGFLLWSYGRENFTITFCKLLVICQKFALLPALPHMG